MVQHGPIACPLTGPCGLSQCSRWSWYCLTSSERKCLIIKGQRLRSRHQLFEVKHDMIWHAVSKTWNEDKMRYIQIITKHLPLRRADSQSLPLPPRMNPLCCNVREWDKAWKMWSCLVQRDSWDLRGRIQKRGTTTILWTTTKERRLTTAQLPLLLVILLSHTVAFLSSRANAILPSSCGHQLPCLNSKCVNQSITSVDLMPLHTSHMHSASNEIYCQLIDADSIRYLLAVISDDVGRKLVVFVNRWGISDSSTQYKLHLQPKDREALLPSKDATEFPLSQNMQPHPHCWRNITSEINSLWLTGFASVHVFQHASTCFKVSRKLDHNTQLQYLLLCGPDQDIASAAVLWITNSENKSCLLVSKIGFHFFAIK